LHLSPAGYEIWTRIVNEYLAQIWPRPAAPGRDLRGVRREQREIASHFLDRTMNLLIFGHGGMRVVAFPTLRGDYTQLEEHGAVEAVSDRLARGELQLYCVDGFDSESFYNQSIAPRERIARHLQYERHILDEVLPLSESVNPGSPVVVQGCSLGAYRAMNIALRHPERFHRVVALSGRYDLCHNFGGGFRDLFDGYYDDEIYFNTPSHFLPNLADSEILRKLRSLDVLIAVGEWDSFVENNRAFTSVLREKGIPHRLLTWAGVAHGYRHWNEVLRLYL
jgi:esterase/lipase superfamily enzyme